MLVKTKGNPMKKTLVIMMMLMTLSNVYAGAGHALRHANPLPNLVRLTLGNAELLQLNAKQVEELRTWARTNKPTIMKLVQKVMNEEKMLHEEALTTDKDVVKNSESMLDARREIIKLKTACRMNLKKVLSEKQYAQVIGIYRSTQPKK